MFEKIEKGVNFDRSLFTRKALKELRQRAAQDDGVACYYLGIYYLGPIKSGSPKALAFFIKALGLAQKTGNTELEADARRKLLVIKIRDFFKKYAIPQTKVNLLGKNVQAELSLIAGLYHKESIHEGTLALCCDYIEAFLPIYYAMLGVAGLSVKEIEEASFVKIPDEAQKKIAKTSPYLMKRVCYLNSMFEKVIEMDQAIGEYHQEQCKECKLEGCAIREPTKEPTTKLADN